MTRRTPQAGTTPAGTPRARRATPPSLPAPSRYELYERCVQLPGASVRFLRAVHGGTALILREDFCGSGGLSREWVRQVRGGRAIAVDLDADPLASLKGVEGVRTVRGDVRLAKGSADVIAATNFPLGYWYERRDLVGYLRACHGRLRRSGVFIADVYGGRDAMKLGTTTDEFVLPDGRPVHYEWEHRSADPVTGRVFNVIHFTVGTGRSAIEYRDAFTYDWRLWSIPELRDAYLDAGFSGVDVYDQQGGALDVLGRLHVRPLEPGEGALDPNWVVFVAGRR